MDRRKSADAMGRPQSADLLDKSYRIAWGISCASRAVIDQ
jgi:hypothetical protein